MGEIRMTRDFFLWCMSVIYLFAFGSLFVQIPGLYGDNGILPVKLVLQKEAESMGDLLQNQPSLLRLLPRLGLDGVTGMDFLCLGGVILSFAAMVTRGLRNTLVFGLLWVFYLSIFQVGQTFLWFQWDILLLETGFLTMLVAPLNLLRWRGVSHHIHDGITMWLVKWLLFRLMFASGVVKLTSMCPTWWGLTALNYHYETQCLPTALAWYFHQLPEWFQKLSVASVFVIEIIVPFLFFSPIRNQRVFAFFSQLLLQVLIVLTGNYNYFNLLTVTLCISLLDDNFLRRCMGKPARGEDDDPLAAAGKVGKVVRFLLNVVVYGGLLYIAVELFSLRPKLNPPRIESNVNFTDKDFTVFLQMFVPITIWIGALSLGWEILRAVFKSMVKERGMFRKMVSTTGVVVFGVVAIAMFSISLVEHTVIENNAQRNLWPSIHQLHGKVDKLVLTSSYGLFRRMTGVGGRPEVIIEGSNAIDAGWKEYNFRYKPGKISEKPPVVAPHQPRLDWQMWFAALGNYQHNPWFLHLCYRLLEGRPEVLDLLGENPFPDSPPKYIRASLYHYHFTSADKNSNRYDAKEWWTRNYVREYLPILTKEEPTLVNYLKSSGIIGRMNNTQRHQLSTFATAIEGMRKAVGQPEGFLTMNLLFWPANILPLLYVRLKRRPYIPLTLDPGSSEGPKQRSMTCRFLGYIKKLFVSIGALCYVHMGNIFSPSSLQRKKGYIIRCLGYIDYEGSYILSGVMYIIRGIVYVVYCLIDIIQKLLDSKRCPHKNN